MKIKVNLEVRFDNGWHSVRSAKATFAEKQDSCLEEMIPDIFLALCDACARKREERLEVAEILRHGIPGNPNALVGT